MNIKDFKTVSLKAFHPYKTTETLLFCFLPKHKGWTVRGLLKLCMSIFTHIIMTTFFQSSKIYSRLTEITHSHLFILIFTVLFTSVFITPHIPSVMWGLRCGFLVYLINDSIICCSRYACFFSQSIKMFFFPSHTAYWVEALRCLIHHPDGPNGSCLCSSLLPCLPYRRFILPGSHVHLQLKQDSHCCLFHLTYSLK